jgi:hypothetical protein
MRVALTTIHASALVLTLGCTCVQAASPEQREREREPQRSAQPAQAPQREQRNERANPPSPPPAARNDSRQLESRPVDSRVEEMRRQESSSHQNSDAFRRNGRLTADERKDLRRQINEAGQDIYPNTPRSK